MNSIITTITLLPVLDKKIRELAKKKGQTKTSLIQEAISNYLERIEILEIENVGKGYLFLTDKNNENHKYMSDEDVDWYVNWSGEEISDYWVYIYCV